MRRVVVTLLALLGLALVVGSLLVWKEAPVAPPVAGSDVSQPFGSQKTIGTSALSHGGSALRRRAEPMSDYPVTDTRESDRKIFGSASP